MLWFINVFSLRLMRFGHFLFVWLDFRFVKAKVGRNSFAWEEMRTNSIQKSEKPKRYLVAKHIFLIGRCYITISKACDLLAVFALPTYLNRVLVVDGEVSRGFAVLNDMFR